MRLVWSIFILILLVVACVWGYNEYQATQQASSGHVTWVHGQPSPEAKASFDRHNFGDDEAGASSAATSNTSAYPSSAVSGATVAAPTSPLESATISQPVAERSVTPNTLPRTDSQPPLPPNGEAYRGNGVYELYRQGNLTYRMDTATGRTCVAFATLEEWRKPVVMRNGCGRTS